MRKNILLFVSTVAISLLTSCSCGGNPQPEPEPTANTYTVVLRATDGASFDNNKHYLTLNNVKENTILNQVEGYTIPTSPSHLDFSHWTDEKGNIVSENTTVTTNLFLTSDFYHGPEFERNYLKTYINDDLWNIFNIPDWNSPFSVDSEKKQVLRSFSDMCINAISSDKLTTKKAIDAMKEFYIILKNVFFKSRYAEVQDLQTVLNVCQNHLDNTIKEIGNVNSPMLEEAIIYLNISNFIVKSLVQSESEVVDYAYQTLLSQIKSLPQDNRRLCDAWSRVARGLMLASPHLTESYYFNELFEFASSEIGGITDDIHNTDENVKKFAKLCGDYCVSYARIDDSSLRAKLFTEYESAVPKYRDGDLKSKYDGNLIINYFKALASENYSYDTVYSYICEIKDYFRDKIEKNQNITQFYSIGMYFAEAIRRNPSESNYIHSIIDIFEEKIKDDYAHYIAAFTAIASEASKIDLNCEFYSDFDLYYRPPSFVRYYENSFTIIDLIDTVKDASIYSGDNFKAVEKYCHHYAKLSRYGNPPQFDDNRYFRYVNIHDIAIHNKPLLLLIYSPFSIADCALKVSLTKAVFDHTMFPQANEEALIVHIAASAGNQLDKAAMKFSEFIEASFLPVSYAYLTENPNISLNDMRAEETNYCVDAVTQLEKGRGSYLNIDYYLLPLYQLINNKNLYRGYLNNVDCVRSVEALDFVFRQTNKFYGDKVNADINKFLTCIYDVLIEDYIPNITEDITTESRYDLENRVETKIDSLIANS